MEVEANEREQHVEELTQELSKKKKEALRQELRRMKVRKGEERLLDWKREGTLQKEGNQDL